MTLEEEIMKLDLIASDAFEGGDADEFRQLAEWLRELQIYRKKLTEIEEAVNFYKGCESCQGFREYPTDKFVEDLVRILEVNADENSD